MSVTSDARTSELTDDEIRTQVREWLVAHLPKEWVAAIEAGDHAALAKVRSSLDTEQFLADLGESGWGAPTWPVEYAGAGLAPPQARIVNDELNRFQVPRSWNIIGIGMGGPTILQWGTEEQKAKYLLPMVQNKEIWCQLFSEPGFGSDAAGLATRAVRDGDEWVVNGQKVWTTFAHVAKWGLLLARSNPDVPKHKGLSYFIVDMKAPGVEVRPLRQMTGDAEFNEVFFNDVRIPDADRVGPEGEGWRVATTTLMNERVALSGAGSTGGQNVGGGPADELVRRARESGAWEDLVLRDRLVGQLIEARLIKVTNLRSAAARRAGRQPGPEGSVTKLVQAEHNQRLQELAVDMLSAGGTAWTGGDSAAEAQAVRGFLRSRANTIEGGTSEVMRNILGDRVLGLPREPDPSRELPWSEVPRN
ncbi:MAG: acyl-CoA dehydrogenase family protein [Actinobacteria bacterium]|nr:acyl-CoA dehydrogenase family protein [Actinomycetota bacterium]